MKRPDHYYEAHLEPTKDMIPLPVSDHCLTKTNYAYLTGSCCSCEEDFYYPYDDTPHHYLCPVCLARAHMEYLSNQVELDARAKAKLRLNNAILILYPNEYWCEIDKVLKPKFAWIKNNA